MDRWKPGDPIPENWIKYRKRKETEVYYFNAARSEAPIGTLLVDIGRGQLFRVYAENLFESYVRRVNKKGYRAWIVVEDGENQVYWVPEEEFKQWREFKRTY